MNLGEETKPSNFKCKLCENTYKYKKDLKRHILTIHENFTIKCDKCGKEFKRKEYLKQHIKLDHNIYFFDTAPEYICSCGRFQTSNLTSAQKHATTHIKNSKFVPKSKTFKDSLFIYKSYIREKTDGTFTHPRELSTSEITPRILELIEAHLFLHRELQVYIQGEKKNTKFFKKNNYSFIFFSVDIIFDYIDPATEEFQKSLQTPIRTDAHTFKRSLNIGRTLGRCYSELIHLYANYNCEGKVTFLIII